MNAAHSEQATALGRRFCGALTDLAEPSFKRSCIVWSFCIDALRQVSALLDAKAPDDASAFKAWLRQISQSTAEAASEGGGLFGIGGVQVSDAEKATLTEISTALGY